MISSIEFSRPISIEGISPDKVREEEIVATEEECAALAKRFDLRELSNFKAKLAISRISGGAAVRIEGSFEADVVQTCVVSLRDVPSHVEGDFETFFTEEDVEDENVELLFDEDDIPAEAISNGSIDMGELVAQYLSLDLDPYPRAPGVSLAAQLSEAGVEVKNQPFLQVLKGKNGDQD